MYRPFTIYSQLEYSMRQDDTNIHIKQTSRVSKMPVYITHWLKKINWTLKTGKKIKK